MNQFEEYAQHGWKICRIEPGTKGPRTMGWNTKAGVDEATANASTMVGAGLCHSYSGTCAIDIDHFDEAAAYLKEHRIDLVALFNAPDAVQISSGRKNRGKLIYKIPASINQVKLRSASGNDMIDFRCQAKTGLSVQDVLPPSIHPDTKQPYQWIGDWKNVPEIPPTLLALWQLLLVKEVRKEPMMVKDTPQTKELRDLLTRRDPSMGYDEWIKVGMALHNGTGGSDEGLAIWDEWSTLSEKYPGLEVLRSHWTSFRGSDTPVTVDSLRRLDTADADLFDDVSNDPEIRTFDALEARPVVPPFQFLSLVDLFKRPEPDWIIEGILPEAGFGAIYGQPSAGKTFLEVDIALSIALGHNWRNKPVKQGRVLIVAAEDDRGMQMRLAAGLAARGLQDAPVRVLPASPALTDKAQAKALLEAIKREEPPSVIFIDTLAAVTPGADENSAKDMGELVSYCYKIHKVTGALVIMVHHEGKNPGRGLRGSSVLLGAVDVLWEVTKDELQHELVIQKLKNAPIGEAYNFKLSKLANSAFVDWV